MENRTNTPESAQPAETLVDFFQARLRHNPAHPAIRHQQGGAWQQLTWREVGDRVAARARVLRQLGVAAGDRVAQIAENSLDWLLTDLAALVCGAIHVPLHPTLSGIQLAEQLANREPRIALLSGETQAAKLRALPAASPFGAQFVPRITWLTYVASADEPTAIHGQTLRTLAALAAPFAEEASAEEILTSSYAPRPETLATILYTSGTTGEPKGVMLSHANLVSNVLAMLAVMPHAPGDVRLAWLPLSHIFGRTCDWYTTLGSAGVEMALGESRDTLLADCAVVRPTLLNGVPYFFEKVARGVQEKGAPASVLQQLLGGNMRMCMSGGAALAEHIARYYHSGGIELLQGYGLTETSPVITINRRLERAASVGPAIPGVEIRIAADGEIETRGPHVMQGYWRNAQATAAVLADGWFRTGDLGALDDEGYLTITGRKKEILVTSAGKNIAPVFLEGLLTQSPLIDQAMVVGDARKFLGALLVVNRAELARQLGTEPASMTPSSAAAQELLEHAVREQLSAAADHEQVRRFVAIDEPFSIEAGDLTPTLKLRRDVIARKYARQIDGMYGE